MLNETTPAARLLFTQGQRLKTPEQFQKVYDRKKSASDSSLIVYVCENDVLHPRLGVSVSKKIGGAVVRNRFKRLFREAFRLTQHELPRGVDIIMIPRPKTEPTTDQLKASLVKLVKQAAQRLTPTPRSEPPK